jgi:hypothetical protein
MVGTVHIAQYKTQDRLITKRTPSDGRAPRANELTDQMVRTVLCRYQDLGSLTWPPPSCGIGPTGRPSVIAKLAARL